MGGTTVVVGVDGGGSGTRAAVGLPGGGILAQAAGAAGNVATRGVGPVARTIRSLVLEAMRRAHLGPTGSAVAVVGCAGTGTSSVRERFAARLRDLLPGVAVRVVTDVDLILAGDVGPGPGVAVVAGTGSAVRGVAPGGVAVRVGGWGPLAGDEGSGYWMARRLLAAVTSWMDGLPGPADLGQACLDRVGARGRDDLAAWLRGPGRRVGNVAALAPLVLSAADAGHAWASVLADEGAAHLAAQAAAAARRLGDGPPPPVVLAGGLLMGSPGYRARVRRACAGHAGLGEVRTARPAVESAWDWARSLVEEVREVNHG